MNDEDDANVLFILFHNYRNIRSCSFNKQLFPEHVKPCPSCTNTENVNKEKVTTWKSLVQKSCGILDFHSEYNIPEIKTLAFNLPHVYILEKKLYK